MSRRKCRNPDEASDAEDTRLAHRREVEAVVAEMLAEAAAPVQDDGVRVLVGDAAEDAEAYQDHRDELARAYGVTTPLEEMLVDRLAALAWRLNRLQRVERGAVTVRTESAAKAEHRRREHDAIRQRTENVARGRPAAEDDNPEVIRHALDQLRGLAEQYENGATPDPSEAFKPLVSVFGMTPDNRFKGRGEMISVLAYNLHTGLHDDRHPDAEEVRQAAPKMRAYLASELREVEAIMQARLAVVQAEARTLTTAAIEAKSWLREDDLKGYVAYERHLQHALREATRELERAVARRRLRGLARTIGG